MGRISRSMTLVRTSWEVLKADKKLLIFPLLSGAASLVVAISFIIPIALTEGAIFQGERPIVGYVVAFLGYLVFAFITIFFNSALVHAVNERLDGGTPTVASGLRGAVSRIGSIFAWSLVAATVSVILRAIEERVGIVGRILVGLFGLAWTLITFLVIPVLVIEGVGVRDAVRKSGEMFKRTWGENVIAQIGFGLVAFLLILPAVVVLPLAASSGSGGLVAVVAGVVVVWFLLLGLVMTALNGIFQTALYRYAAGKPAGAGFSDELLGSAFQPKKRSRG